MCIRDSLRTVGELLQNQFRIGLARMERVVKERMTIQDIEVTTPQALMNIRPVTVSYTHLHCGGQDGCALAVFCSVNISCGGGFILA